MHPLLLHAVLITKAELKRFRFLKSLKLRRESLNEALLAPTELVHHHLRHQSKIVDKKAFVFGIS